MIAYIAQNNQETPAGFIFCWAIAGECELLCLAVEEAFRRQGLAKKLCEQAKRDAQKLGASKIHLEVAIGNQAAQALYRQLGFEIVRRRKAYYHYFDGTMEDALSMRIEL